MSEDKLPNVILISWIAEVDRYRLITPFFTFRGLDHYPGMILEKYEYENILFQIKKQNK